MKVEMARDLQLDCERAHSKSLGSETATRLEGSTIFITGGTGFLGNWVCQYLLFLKRTYGINMKTFVLGRDRQRFEKLAAMVPDLDVDFVQSDIKRLTDLPRNVNFVIHAAGNPDSRFHMTNPMETMTDIAEGTRSLLKAADRLSDLRMVATLSSGSVYGSQPDTVANVDEKHELAKIPLDSVRSVYTEAKRYAEVLTLAARHELRLPAIILRPFTFLGPFQSLEAPWAINNFINDGLKGRPIRILGDGRAVRGYLYGADLAAWTIRALTNGTSGQLYNIGSPQGHTLREIAERVALNFSPRPEIILNASLLPNQTQNRYLADINKICSDQGVALSTGLETAIERTVQWFSRLQEF